MNPVRSLRFAMMPTFRIMIFYGKQRIGVAGIRAKDKEAAFEKARRTFGKKYTFALVSDLERREHG